MGILNTLFSAGMLIGSFGLAVLLAVWVIKNDNARSIKSQTGLFKMRDFEAEERQKARKGVPPRRQDPGDQESRA